MKRTLALLFVLALLLSLAVPALAAEDYELQYSNMNGERVESDPPSLKQITLKADLDPLLVEKITTYHWNEGYGGDGPIYISIWEGDTQLGEWQATPSDNYYYWSVFPNIVMIPGHTYVVRDSELETWSYNEASGNCGMFELYGSFVPGYVAPGGYDEVVTYRDIKIVLDGTLIIPRDANGDVVDPFILNGTTYLPLRAVAGALGLGIQWDGPTSTITLTSGAAKAANYGESSGNVGTALYTLVYRGIKIILDGALITPRDASGNVVEPFIIDGTTYLPVRALSNALGFDVGGDNATSTVSISSGASSGGSQSGGSGWVMIYEKATQTPDYESPSGIYFDTYSWEKDEEKGLIRGYSKQEAKPDDPTRHYQCTQFETTCTLPPKSGAPGEKVTFDLTAALVETISDQYYFGASCSIQTAAPGSGPDVAGRYCWNVLDEGADWDYHLNTPTAGIGGGNIDPGDSCTVFWRFPQNPQPGDRTSVYFRTNAVQIEWCYEYREGGVPASPAPEPGNGGSQPPAPTPEPGRDDSGRILRIRTLQDLLEFAADVNGGEDYAGLTVTLDADLTLNTGVLDDSLALNSGSFVAWEPIGTSQHPFRGVFEGNGHTISGLYANDGDKAYQGLFGVVEGAEVRNVTVADSWFSVKECAGPVVGCARQRSVIDGCVSKGCAVYTKERSGGIVGWTDHSDVYNCEAYVLCSSERCCGGIVGDVYSDGKIYNCSVAGKVLGNNLCCGITGGSTAADQQNCLCIAAVEGYLIVGGPGYRTTAWCYALESGGQSLGVDYDTVRSFGADAMLSAPVTVGEKSCASILEALNAWVDMNSGNGMRYLRWQQGGGYPYLNFGG